MIDTHHHLWDLAVREQPWLIGDQAWATEEQLAPLRRSFTAADLASARLIAPIGLDTAKNFDKAQNIERLLRE